MKTPKTCALSAALLSLACGGMLDIFVPDLPVALPPERRVMMGLGCTERRESAEVRGFSEGADRAAVRRHFVDQLSAGGWRFEETEAADGAVSIEAVREAQRLTILLGGGDTPPTEFYVMSSPCP